MIVKGLMICCSIYILGFLVPLFFVFYGLKRFCQGILSIWSPEASTRSFATSLQGKCPTESTSLQKKLPLSVDLTALLLLEIALIFASKKKPKKIERLPANPNFWARAPFEPISYLATTSSKTLRCRPSFLPSFLPSFVLVVVLPALYREQPRPVFPAGPQPRAAMSSLPCRTSTATIRTSTATICAQCSLPGLNREIDCQKECQTECQKRCQKICQKCHLFKFISLGASINASHQFNIFNYIFSIWWKKMMPWQICFQFQFQKKEIPIPMQPSKPKTIYMNAKCIHNTTIDSSNFQNPNAFSTCSSYESYDQIVIKLWKLWKF